MMKAPIDVYKTMYGDYVRFMKRYSQDIDNLTNLISYTKNKEAVKRYQDEIERLQSRITEYGNKASDIYNEWQKEMNIIWLFGDFWYYIENGYERGVVW